jgi:hypothetical protein
MPTRNNPDLARITADLAKARQRVAQMTAGQVGAIPAEAFHCDPGRAFENQLNARHADVARLEGEYVQAKLATGEWTAARIIEEMQ